MTLPGITAAPPLIQFDGAVYGVVERFTLADARSGRSVALMADLFSKALRKDTPFPVRWLLGRPAFSVESVNTRAESSDLSITVTGTLDSEWMAPLSDLIAAATSADGTSPLSEQALLDLRADAPSTSHVLAVERRRQLVGYAFVNRGDRSHDATA
jgi:hypothetical protein